MFKVKLQTGQTILAYTSGKMRKFYIRILIGDRAPGRALPLRPDAWADYLPLQVTPTLPSPRGEENNANDGLLYALILLSLAAALWGAYKVLGTPSRLAPRDYDVVLEDIKTSVERAAARLRRALDAGAGSSSLEAEATAARKIFQDRLLPDAPLAAPGVDRTWRPMHGPRSAAPAKQYDWASRMLGSESVRNPSCWRQPGA